MVRLVEELGADAYLHGRFAGAARTADTEGHDIVTRVDPAPPPQIGDTVYLRVRPGQEHAFPRRPRNASAQRALTRVPREQRRRTCALVVGA